MQRPDPPSALRSAFALLAYLGLGGAALAQSAPEATPADASGAVETVRAPAGSAPAPGPARPIEIFPDSARVWMRVHNTDPRPIEQARRGGAWLCKGGQCAVTAGDPSKINAGDGLLQAIKLTTATLPLPLAVWRPGGPGSAPVFDPSLVGRRSYKHLCAFPPVGAPTAGNQSLDCPDSAPSPQPPDTGELTLALRWPTSGAFKYLAIVDACGYARVQPFQQQFTVPVALASSGGCAAKEPKVLRIFASGGFVQVTAFNLEQPSSGDVMRTTYRVATPALDSVESGRARLLFPDVAPADFEVDCGPSLPKTPTDRPPPAPPGTAPTALVAHKPPSGEQRGPGPVSLSHGGALIGPDPLRQGQCKIRLKAVTRGRLIAPLALHVSLTRTDKPENGAQAELVRDGTWIVTPTSFEFSLPPLSEGFDGESRLRLVVSSDPLSPHGSVMLLSDAASYRGLEGVDRDRARRPLGSLVIHSAPLCGKNNFELLEGKRSCFRAYITIPAIVGMVQITRAPWTEKPLITRNVLSAVGAALAFDAYDPVERRAFPIAAQVGGLFENLGDGKLGVLGYVGVAPMIPMLGSGGNTTSIGLLGGVGLAYVVHEKGPDEGVKPAAFLSVLVSVGQASPWSK